MINRAAYDLTSAEVVAGALVGAPALLIVTVYVVNRGGWRIDPVGIPLLAALLVVMAFIVMRRRGAMPHVAVELANLAGFTLVVSGVAAYILLLSRPSYLPISQSPDFAHHLSLVAYIQQHRSLVYDASLTRYLGEMATYTPGSHILAALAATWLHTDGIFVLQPILALLVAVKAGIVYNIILRLLPDGRRHAALALVGALLLFIPFAYFIGSFTGLFFFAQVVCETFAIAMLWALTTFHQKPGPLLLAFFALCGMTLWLVWPLWLPAPVAGLALVVLAQRNLLLRVRVKQLLLALVPIVVITADYSVHRLADAVGVIQANGGVEVPSIDLYGKPILVLALLGLLVSARQWRTAPLWAFTLGLAAQTAALYVLDTVRHVESYYQTYKMFYLLLYPLVVFATLGIAALWALADRPLPTPWRRRTPAFAVSLPLLVLFLVLTRDVPTSLYTSVTLPMVDAGLWAKANLPTACVDYVGMDWSAVLWLHDTALGNPRAMPRNVQLELDYDSYLAAVKHWPYEGGQPFAIIAFAPGITPNAPPHSQIRFQRGGVIVAQQAEAASCADQTPPLDHVPVAPRGWTVAGALAALNGR